MENSSNELLHCPDEGQVEEIIAYLQEAVEAAEEGDVAFSDVEGEYEDALARMLEFISQTNEYMDNIDINISSIEDMISLLDDCFSDFE